jgi:hypothetical protein
MLSYDLQLREGILVITPDGPLEASDFTALAGQVDAYLGQHGVLNGVMIRAKAFPGWKDFGALLAHLKFVKSHHQKIDKVAVVADGGFATVMPHIGSHFVHAEVKHFDYAQEDAARNWLMENSLRLTGTA